MWSVKLESRLPQLLQGAVIIERANLHNLGVAECRAITEKCAAAVSTEMGSDGVASIGSLLANRLWGYFGDLESLAWHDDVGAISATGNLAAILAMA